MGDRGNIKIIGNGEPPLYFYTHWGGSELREILQAALIRGRTRWDDQAYLARIIFCELLGDDVGGVAGYGISAVQQDSDYPILVVDCETNTVHQEGEYLHKSFEAFVASPSFYDEAEE